MTRENAVKKLIEIATERFNSGRGIMINDIPFYNMGRKLSMEIKEDDNGKLHSVAIMLGVTTVSYITADTINEINVDFHNMLLESGSRVYGYINNEHFEVNDV